MASTLINPAEFAAFERAYTDRSAAIYAAPKRARPSLTEALRREMADGTLAASVAAHFHVAPVAHIADWQDEQRRRQIVRRNQQALRADQRWAA